MPVSRSAHLLVISKQLFTSGIHTGSGKYDKHYPVYHNQPVVSEGLLVHLSKFCCQVFKVSVRFEKKANTFFVKQFGTTSKTFLDKENVSNSFFSAILLTQANSFNSRNNVYCMHQRYERERERASEK